MPNTVKRVSGVWVQENVHSYSETDMQLVPLECRQHRRTGAEEALRGVGLASFHCAAELEVDRRHRATAMGTDGEVATTCRQTTDVQQIQACRRLLTLRCRWN